MPTRFARLPSGRVTSPASRTRPSAGATTVRSSPGIARPGLRKKASVKTASRRSGPPSHGPAKSPPAAAAAAMQPARTSPSRTMGSVGRSAKRGGTAASVARAGSATSVLGSVDQPVLAQPGHEAAQLLPDLLHRVLRAATPQRPERDATRLVLQDELPREGARLDLAQDLAHALAHALVDHARPAGQVTVLGRV